MKLKVKGIKKETAEIISILLEKPTGFNFYPAQFVDIGFSKDTRIMSISTSPTEEYLMFTFKKGLSSYKKRLLKIRPEEKLESTHPTGTYTLDENSPAVMLAGGIGITPHRSMIKYAVDTKLGLPITLIYSNSNENFPFKKELDLWQKNYSKLAVHYLITSREGRLNITKLATIVSKSVISEAIFYLAGPPSFVEDMEKSLRELGIDSTQIRLDSFDGY